MSARNQPKQSPRLLHSSLTGSVYIVTRYVQRDHGVIEAKQKTDCTAEFHRLALELGYQRGAA